MGRKSRATRCRHPLPLTGTTLSAPFFKGRRPVSQVFRNFFRTNPPQFENYSYLCRRFPIRIPDSTLLGEVLEWLKRHAWKACKPLKGFVGSNPILSAQTMPVRLDTDGHRLFFCLRRPGPQPCGQGRRTSARKRLPSRTIRALRSGHIRPSQIFTGLRPVPPGLSPVSTIYLPSLSPLKRTSLLRGFY